MDTIRHEISDTPNRVNQIRKGGTFVQYEPRKTLIFMIVNEVEERTPSMDFCIVTWHIIDYRGLNVQRRFSMAARDGVFSCFVPIPRRLHRDAVSFMRQCDKEIKAFETIDDKKLIASRCRSKLVKMVQARIIMANTGADVRVVPNKQIECQ